MKYPLTVAAGLLAAAVAGLAVAKAPEIDSARIDSMVAEILRQADENPNPMYKPDGKTIRQEVTVQLQTFEVLKNEALKAGLDKDADVQHQFKTVEAQFYANQYMKYLERKTEVSDADLRRMYDQQTRIVKLQQVRFNTPEEARAAQSLLLKGLSFDELVKRHPNEEQVFDNFVMQQQLTPELAAAVSQLNRGDVTREPVKLQNKFYLFKLSAVERNPEAQPFDLIKSKIAREAKQQKVQQQIERLLESNGITPPK